jgi:lysosomal acid lipase/cholesteryl ester hydrolase
MKNIIYSIGNSLNRSSKRAEDATAEVITKKHDKYKSLLEMVRDYEYPVEKHFYETKDSYINCVYRISGPRYSKPQENAKAKRPVVIYQHGLFDSCATICCDGLDSLAFIMADAGYDVWMNNNRGNRFSKHHCYLDPGVHNEYWDFSFQEFADYD